MDDMAEYYRPGSRLTIQLSGQNAYLTVNVLKPITPFRTSQVLLIEAKHGEAQDLFPGTCAILKIYDPRFIGERVASGSRAARPWSLAAEATTARQFQRDPNFAFDIPSKGDWVGWEMFYRHAMENMFWPEKAVYERLISLQGSGIPRCYASGNIILSDRAISPNILLLEYIPDSFSIHDIHIDRDQTMDGGQGLSKLVTPSLAKSMLNTVATFSRLGVTQNDSHPRNFIFSPRGQPTRATVIDFGEGYVREDESDEDWEDYALEQGDVENVKHRLRQALGEDFVTGLGDIPGSSLASGITSEAERERVIVFGGAGNFRYFAQSPRVMSNSGLLKEQGGTVNT